MSDGFLKTRPARPAPPAIGRYSAKIFADLAGRTRFVDPALAANWTTLVGAEIAALCRPGRLTGGQVGATLELHAPHAAAAARTQFEAEAIRRRLNNYLGPGRIGRITVLHLQGPAPVGESGLDGALSRFRASLTGKK